MALNGLIRPLIAKMRFNLLALGYSLSFPAIGIRFQINAIPIKPIRKEGMSILTDLRFKSEYGG